MNAATVAPAVLANEVRVRPGYLRATNLEQHAHHLGHYIPTGRALDIIGRLTRTLSGDGAGHAWSLTGPYGAGKSSFAVFLRTLLGPDTTNRAAAIQRLNDASPGSWEQLTKATAAVGAGERGFVLATTTCQPESVTDSILRGLQHGVEDYWSGRRKVPEDVHNALVHARTTKAARAVAEAVRVVARRAPVLLLLDEFGKTLEHFAAHAAHTSDADLFVLQEIAELATTDVHPVLLITLQHLAFDDYVRGAALSQRREWGKIAGRFEDVPFLETAEQSLRLVVGALDDTHVSAATAARRTRWAEAAHTELATLGLDTRLPGGADTLARSYPLHPVALLALPTLCARLGQHGRTLFSFLAGSEEHTLGRFLQDTPVPGPGLALPTLDLPAVFDFFAGPGQAMSASAGARWSEIETRVREATGLASEDVHCLKVVGLLNLLSDATGLRASAAIVGYALSPADSHATGTVRQRLEDLEARGWLTYRGFADEYRLWQGSDVDLRTRVADAREQLRSTSTAGLLAGLRTTGPLIAGKHTQEVGMLRYFTPAYADMTTRRIAPLDPADPADGAVIYFLGDPAALDDLEVATDSRPVLVATSTDASIVQDAAIEAAAALAVLDQRDVAADRVARRELQDRAADARRRLADALDDAFRPGSPAVTYRVRTDGEWGPPRHAAQGVSRLLSEVCDDAYNHSPQINNEMLGRRELTSQGAKARRVLLEAMVDNPHLDRLGIKGYGPERSMYEAFLRHTGLHRQEAAGSGTWGFHAPTPNSHLNYAWGILNTHIDAAAGGPVGIDELYRRLKATPIGLKDGPIPVLLAALLLSRADDLAIYQDGTYQPTFGAELLERLVKTPQRFAVKAFGLAGPRAKVLTAIIAATSPDADMRASTRNATVLRAAGPLLNAMRALPAFTQRTKKKMPGQALRVRDALLAAREPDLLLFCDLPAACDLEPVPAKNSKANPYLIDALAQRLTAALDDLARGYTAMLDDCKTTFADEFQLDGSLAEARTTLRGRALRLTSDIVEPRLKSLLFTATTTDLDDEEWFEALALSMTTRSPMAWVDDDITRFNNAAHELAGAFRRVEALHYEASAQQNEGFTAHRLTITTHDGREGNTIVWMDHSKRNELNELTSAVIERAKIEIGAGGPTHLLASLAAKLLDLAERPQAKPGDAHRRLTEGETTSA